jgi:hypothetical protein
MKNGKFNTYPARADQDPSKPLPAFRLPEVKNRPAWWTANDDADRNTAARGCMIPESDCIDCNTRCPLNLRTCRTCQHFNRPTGTLGTFRASGADVISTGYCTQHWRALI